jgi:hypothetical protein
MFLTPADLLRLTGKRRFTAQCRALDALGIAYRTAATGEPLVRAESLDATPKAARNGGPRWDRIGV